MLAPQRVLQATPCPLINPQPMSMVSQSLQVQVSPVSYWLTTLLIKSTVLSSTPGPFLAPETKAQSSPVEGARNLRKRQDQSVLILLTSAREAIKFSLVIQTSQLNLTGSAWMTTKKLCPGAPQASSIFCLMYLALASRSLLQKPLAELAKLMKDVICSGLTPAPVKLLNWRALLEVESCVDLGSVMVTARAVAMIARTRKAVFILNDMQINNQAEHLNLFGYHNEQKKIAQSCISQN